MIKDSDERLELAKKFSCHHVIIDVCKHRILKIKSFSGLSCKIFQDFASKKDRRGLLIYKGNLPKQTESYYYADTILKSPVSSHFFYFIIIINYIHT